MKKRILAVLLALLLVCSAIPAQIFAEDTKKDDLADQLVAVLADQKLPDFSSLTEENIEAMAEQVLGLKDVIASKKTNCAWWIYWMASVDGEGTIVKAINLLDKDTWKAPQTLEVAVRGERLEEDKEISFVYDTNDVEAELYINDAPFDKEDNHTFAEYDLEDGEGIYQLKKVGFLTDEKVDAAKEVGDYKAVFELTEKGCELCPIFGELLVKCGTKYVAHTHFSVNPKSINDDEIVKVSSVVYYKGDLAAKGELYLPEITAQYKDEKLVEGKDYYVEYFKYVYDEDEDKYVQEPVEKEDITLDDPEVLASVSRYAVKVVAMEKSNYCEAYCADFVVSHPIVTYMDGDKEVTHMNVFYGDKAEKLDITKEGYKLTWCADAELKEEYDFDTPVTEDITLYAKWTAVTPATGVQGTDIMMMVGGFVALAALAVIVLKKRSVQR